MTGEATGAFGAVAGAVVAEAGVACALAPTTAAPVTVTGVNPGKLVGNGCNGGVSTVNPAGTLDGVAEDGAGLGSTVRLGDAITIVCGSDEPDDWPLTSTAVMGNS